MRAELVCDGKHELAEGPVWHKGALWWVNINAGELHRLGEKRQVRPSLGCAAPCADGRWLCGAGGELGFYDWQSARWETIAVVEQETRNRFNDGKCDPAGRFWVGSMSRKQEAATGGLYVMDGALRPKRVLTERMISNGLAWSPDGSRMYHTDSWTRRVEVFDCDGDRISAGRKWAEFEAFPDGMASDAAGNVWVALWGGSSVVCLDGTTGRTLEKVELPVSQVSSCAFGGEDLATLYITTAHEHLQPEQRAREPLAGGIFAARPGVKGLAVAQFKF
ncbi:MAG TPA: SMP-30/gluconolactonase/LRE family protein [Verrucomicrobiae bacterium]|jgi:sugar lactone lactonase YvrE|nr:SMP-30/gluconolactonase/LRE family protein [Verrucomicrobiae bacterium]